MKVCVNCGKEVPDSALHCVFCGARQPGARAAQKTLLGHSDLGEEISRRQAAARAGATNDDGAPTDDPDSSRARTVAYDDGLSSPGRPPDSAAEDTDSAVTQVAGHAFDEGAASDDPRATLTGHALGFDDGLAAAPVGPAPTAASAPPATRPTTKNPPSPATVTGEHVVGADSRGDLEVSPGDDADPFGATQPLSRDEFEAARQQLEDLEAAPVASAAAPAGAAVDAMAATTEGPPPAELPPFLASETHTRHNAPIEPYARRMRNQLLTFGGLLAIGILLPWQTGGPRGTLFIWHALASSGGTPLFAGALVASAVAALVLGLIRLPVGARGTAALACGAVPIAALSIGMMRGPATAGVTVGGNAPTFLVTLGLLMLACGLLVRSQYRAALTGRALATAGALLTFAALLLPAGDAGSVLSTFSERVAAVSGRGKPAVVVGAAPAVLAAVGLLAWIPTGISFGAGVLAWVVILWAPVAQLLSVLGGQTPLTLAALYHGPVALTAWYALAAYGVATVAGKQLEHE